LIRENIRPIPTEAGKGLCLLLPIELIDIPEENPFGIHEAGIVTAQSKLIL